MSNDRLVSSDLQAGPVKDTDAALAPQNDAGRQRKRGVFTEYRAAAASPDAYDTRALLQTIARLDAAMHEAPSQVTAGLLRGLAEFAAAIKQIESVLSAGEAPAPAVHFAVEHMQDIAMALRSREVESALCDTLDAAIREVGDAIVRSDAAASRTQNVAALLRELVQQISQIIAPGDDIADAASEKTDAPAAFAAKRFDSNLHEPLADGAAAAQPDFERQVHLDVSVAGLPDKQARSEPSEDQPSLFERASVLRTPNIVEIEPAGESDQADTSAPNLALPAATDAAEANAHAALAEPALDVSGPESRDIRAAANHPLAAFDALSDEEIIALFS